MDVEIKDLLDLDQTIAKDLFGGKTYPWEVLPDIKDFILKLGPTLDASKFGHPMEDVWIAKSAKVAESATIAGPLIIDEEAEVRPGAYIRGNAIIGRGATFGNSCEIKNSVMFNESQTPHFNYVGDSVIGYKSHIGAGGITSNLKSDKTNVVVKSKNGEEIETGLRKFGAILGDNVEVGCNSVLNPGTVIGRSSMVYPTSGVRGFVPANSIFKAPGSVVAKK